MLTSARGNKERTILLLLQLWAHQFKNTFKLPISRINLSKELNTNKISRSIGSQKPSLITISRLDDNDWNYEF